MTLAHGATPCLRPLRRTAFRLAPHPAERDSAGGYFYNIACAVHMPLPRFAVGWGYFYNIACAVHMPASVCGRGGATSINNSLRCARACLGLNSGWGIAYIMVSAVCVPLPRFEVGVGHCLYNSQRCALSATSVCGRGGALFKEMPRPKGSLGPMVKVIPR